MSEARATTHFGDTTVALEDKQGLVNEVFDAVSPRYDLMNDLMSLGVHRLWKDAMVSRLAPPRSGGRPFRVLDLAGGTGDIAERIHNHSHGFAKVTVADISPEMLAEGAKRAKSWRFGAGTEFITANAEDLPFDTDTFDAVTIAFGIRNVPRIEKALSEAFRVLTSGGRLLVLEFSKPDVPVVDTFYEQFCDRIIPPLGAMVMGDDAPYRYLVESIRRFPGPAAFCQLINEAGFSRVTHTALSANIAALHSGWKI
ncbi:MAG: class I SAM-dependent methyltransferase [Alphaproteobacteria bacterium]|nr:class I SAM-dependent methyltransferase [Alphaproteobacteria bacterium]